jgi:hypothetical protein
MAACAAGFLEAFAGDFREEAMDREVPRRSVASIPMPHFSR